MFNSKTPTSALSGPFRAMDNPVDTSRRLGHTGVVAITSRAVDSDMLSGPR
jgi:hypothetical protein